MTKLKIVTIGGGTGQNAIVQGLKDHDVEINAIVGVTDNGGSSGIVRQAMDIPQPADSRSVLCGLGDDKNIFNQLLKYRFDEGSLKGTNLGNLIVAALTRIKGDFNSAVQEISKILELKSGKILPVTNQSTQICAELLDGDFALGEWEIILKSQSNIKRLFLQHKVKANPDCIKAINQADMIVICPGSLRTGIISILLVGKIADALIKSKAKKVYICNIMTHPGQTDKFTVSKHIAEIKKYCNTNLDYVLVNNGKPSAKLLEAYKKDNVSIVKNDNVHNGFKVIEDDFISDLDSSQLVKLKRSSRKGMLAFPHLIRHDSKKVAKVLIDILHGKI